DSNRWSRTRHTGCATNASPTQWSASLRASAKASVSIWASSTTAAPSVARRHEKTRAVTRAGWCRYGLRSGLFGTLEAVQNLLARFVERTPAKHLDPLARLQILVMLEEVHGLAQQQLGQVIGTLHLVVQRR